MHFSSEAHPSAAFLKSLGFPDVRVHRAFKHFDFITPGRRILVIGPMGSGKTEFSARVYRDSKVLAGKSDQLGKLTTTAGADRRNLFFVRSMLDQGRFPDYPADALAYRGGYESMGANLASIASSFDLEKLLDDYPQVGTWILDEASFYDERIAYVVRRASEERGLTFIFPALVLNFRREIFNPTAKLLLEMSTDVIPLTAYCEHPDCAENSVYTYRYYTVDGVQAPALYFDPLIIIGGDRIKDDPREPNYCTRCDKHHHLPGKDYTYLSLKPMAEAFARRGDEALVSELQALAGDVGRSALCASLQREGGGDLESDAYKALSVPLLAEKALIFAYAELNVISSDGLLDLTKRLSLDWEYISARLKDNGRPLPTPPGWEKTYPLFDEADTHRG